MNAFTNENIDLDSIPKYEEITLTAPHPNYWKIIAISICICLLILGLSLLPLLIFNDELRKQLIYFVLGYIAFAIILFAFYRASFKKRGFALREKDIVYKHGIIAETTTIIPLNRIQHVALDEGLFSRMYRLGKLQVFTAGGQSGHLNIGGIEIEKAKSMRELLLRKIDLIEQTAEKNDEQ